MFVKYSYGISIMRTKRFIGSHLSSKRKLIYNFLVSSDTADIEVFIMDKYNEWQAAKYVTSTLTAEDRARFSRRQGADLMEKIISASAI